MKETINSRRRRVMKQLAVMAGGSSLLASQAKFELIGSALAAGNYQGLTDYKSLVCVFLFGGCDTFSLLIPNGADRYQVYANIRGDLAIPRGNLLPVAGGGYGFHPEAGGLQTLFNEGRLAVVQNVGALFQPLTVDQFFRGAASGRSIPPDLFSHSHQTEFWQTCKPSVPTRAQSGWGGLAADLLIEANSNPLSPASFTLDGNNNWQIGGRTQPYGVRPGQNIPTFEAFDGATWPQWKPGRSAAWNEILNLTQSRLLDQQAKLMMTETRRRSDLLREALEQSPELTTPYNERSGLAKQLRSVAKLISIRQALGMKRQIFFVGIGGWDTHGDQQATLQRLVPSLSGALESFYRTTQELGVADSVTTFTMSEFGRTFTANGDGTDHAWATNMFVVGGKVSGGQLVGDPIEYSDQPTQSSRGDSVFGPNDVGGGRFIPKYSVDQYGATLGRWLGLTDADLLTIFPNLGEFTTRNLGFMA